MSYWTHICAVIDVDTHIEDKYIRRRVLKMLKKAPKITGSERDAEIFVNVRAGHNTSTDQDCEKCQYGPTIVNIGDGWQECAAEDNFKCPCNDYQTRVVITVVGDLRDRKIRRTRDEWNTFIDYIENKISGEHGFTICNKSCNIIGP